jgi:hypothetical protein
LTVEKSAEAHAVTVRAVNAPRLRAACSCGWLGEPTTSEHLALADHAAHAAAGLAEETAGRTAVLSWDWRGQPDLARLGRLVADLSGGTLHLAEPDTGSDQYAVVLSTAPLDDETATRVYGAGADGGDGLGCGGGPARPVRRGADGPLDAGAHGARRGQAVRPRPHRRRARAGEPPAGGRRAPPRAHERAWP